MLTEVKKTVHIVVDDLNAVPDEMMIQNALNRNVQAMVTPGTMEVRVFDEYGHAQRAAMKVAPPMNDTDKVCPPIDRYNISYHIWSVQMHFIRQCAFEPEIPPAQSIVAVVEDKCREMAVAIVNDVPEEIVKTGQMHQMINNIADKLQELFQEGMFSLGD